MILTTLVAALGLAGQAPSPPLPTAPVDASDPVGLGSCIGQDGPLDLRRALFLENRTLDFIADGAPLRIALLGQRVRISTLSPSGDQLIHPRNIGEMVAAPEGAADVDLKLALFAGRLVVYWRETVQHRIYRQGLLRVDGPRLTALCEGRAGSESSH